MNADLIVGAELRDKNTGGRVRLTAINPPHPRTGRIRSGFTWVNLGGTRAGDTDHEGFCPASCSGAFEVIPPPTTWAQRNVPTWWAWRQRRTAKARKAREILEALHEDYAEQDFSHGWQEQDWQGYPDAAERDQLEKQRASEKILGELAQRRILQNPIFAESRSPTLEQQLAATIAGGALGGLRTVPGVMIYHDSVASDSLDLARQIIAQTEKE